MTNIVSPPTKPKAKINTKKSRNDFIFVFAMWLFSRLLIIAAMYLIAPVIEPDVVQSDPKFITAGSGWERFADWDGN